MGPPREHGGVLTDADIDVVGKRYTAPMLNGARGCSEQATRWTYAAGGIVKGQSQVSSSTWLSLLRVVAQYFGASSR